VHNNNLIYVVTDNNVGTILKTYKKLYTKIQITNFYTENCISFALHSYYLCTVVMKHPALKRLHIENKICNSISLFGGIKPKIETENYSPKVTFYYNNI